MLYVSKTRDESNDKQTFEAKVISTSTEFIRDENKLFLILYRLWIQ